MSFFVVVIKKLVLFKMYMSRSMAYITLINTAMLLFLMLSNLEQYGIDINLRFWGVPIMLGGIIVLVLFGWFEDKVGIWTEESRVVTERNPQIVALNHKVDSILERLDK